MTDTPTDQLAADIREVDGNNDLGARHLAEALIEKGWIHHTSIPASEPAPAPAPEKIVSLADFTVGERVEVFIPARGDWFPGDVVEIGQLASTVHVGHEFGTATIGSMHRIRKLS